MCGLAEVPERHFKIGGLWKCRYELHMLQMNRVMQMPYRHVCSPNTGHKIPESSWRHRLQLGVVKMSWLAVPHSEVSPVVFTATMTPLSSTNSITSLTPFQTKCKAQNMANTFHHIFCHFAPARHPLCAALGLPEVNNIVFIVDLYVHNLAYHDRW